MQSPEVRFRPDWPSRVLAIFSLVVASLAVGYAVMQSQVALTQESLLNQFDHKLQEQLDTRKPQFDQLLADLRQSASEVRVEGERDLDDFLSASEKQMNGLVQDKVEQLTAAAVTQDQRISALEDELNRVQLSRVQVPDAPVLTYRPTVNDSCVQVQNGGTQEVVVSAVRFIPSEVEQTRRLQLDPFEPASEGNGELDRPVVFSAADNQSSDPESHGQYRHQLEQPLRLQPGQQALLRLAIRNPDHAGWALIGDLALDGADSELYRIRTVAAPFVDR